MFPFATTSVGGSRGTPGGDALLESAPALKDATERLVAALAKSLQTMAGTATSIEGMTTGFAASTVRHLVSGHNVSTVAAQIECPTLPCTILAMIDAPLVHTMVEILCGGNGAEPPREAPRIVTPIDQQFAHTLVVLAAAAIQREWGENGFGPTRAVRLDGAPSLEACGQRVVSIGVISIAIVAFGLTGVLRLALPSAALERFAPAEPRPADRVESSDPLWGTRLHQEIGRAPITLKGYLEGRDLSLREIADLKVGQILSLGGSARSRASLVCDGRVLYRGEVGQADDRFSLRVDEIVADLPQDIKAEAQTRPLFEPVKA